MGTSFDLDAIVQPIAWTLAHIRVTVEHGVRCTGESGIHADPLDVREVVVADGHIATVQCHTAAHVLVVVHVLDDVVLKDPCSMRKEGRFDKFA